MQQKTVFAALVGAPNAGKSTLTNRLVGTKVSIVTPKVQTTRARMTGIVMAGDTQLVLIDTPGIFTPQKRLDEAMVSTAWNEVGNSDVTALLIDATKCRNGLNDENKKIIDGVAKRGGHTVLLINKVDSIKKKESLLALTQEISERCTVERIFMLSALKGDGVEDFKNYLLEQARNEPWPFDSDQVSTIPGRLFAAEITREQLMLRLQQELPYELMVDTEEWQEMAPTKKAKKGAIQIRQLIYVTRDSHKRIVVGKAGQNIKMIGEAARKQLTYHFGVPVHLFLFVKVDEKWQQKPDLYRSMGFDS